jgi:hypothetical protein
MASTLFTGVLIMAIRFIAASSALLIVSLVTYTFLFNSSASASPQELTVVSLTRGGEVLKAEVIGDEVRIRLKNNHGDTITAFAIKLSDTTIKVDFAQSSVQFGIEPGDTFEKSFAFSTSATGEPPTVYLLTVLLKNGAKDGNRKIAEEIEDARLGEKIQILRALRILEKQGQSRKDLKTIKSDIEAALNAGDFETRMVLNELQPGSRTDGKFSDHLKNGLQWGRTAMQRKLEVVEQLPTESRERALMKLKERLEKLFAKL